MALSGIIRGNPDVLFSLKKEFARRLLANPRESEFNRLVVNVKLVADVEFVMNMRKKDFFPCPKVDSYVVKIHPKAEIPEHKRMLVELMKLQETKGDEENNTLYSDYHVNDTEDKDGRSNEDNANFSSDVVKDLNFFRDIINDILCSGGFEDKRP
ncbi:hypothetical protein RND71_015794 [Anisodus tanguticus]|uniref:rRNA adenine N(6)-methyltransferase n=1 Tax=Anisodus tanguticus TaxID=243964 RepID=A0AAE1VI12_9SOLA|nr:hypothetical protein RND71_015794 [Anisodus tanguticus]